MSQSAGMTGIAARGPDGCLLTVADLPSPDTKRWVIRRKAIIAAAVRGGLLPLAEACSRYRLNPEELLSWQYYIDRYGFSGLRTTKVQSYVRLGQRKLGSGVVADPTLPYLVSGDVTMRGTSSTGYQE